MSISVAFLSGKGGSGKTTLALSMADLLCRCGVKTLLVDCDLSTNGATYFYESQINEWNNSHLVTVSSFSGILSGRDGASMPIPLSVSQQLDFIPSISEISREWTTETAIKASGNAERRLDIFLDWTQFDSDYDVVLLDCQAGHSEFLPVLLPRMDADLFVLEADSISASAMRSLHLKDGKYFGRARLYQVFNKATPEEFDIYSKIVGTFFTNIGTLRFDWKIRQAFSRSQMPDLENFSADFGMDLCEICNIIFQKSHIQEKVSNFADQLAYRGLEERRNELEKKIDEEFSKSAERKETSVFAVSMFCGMIAAFMTGIALPTIAGLNVKQFLQEPYRFMIIPTALASVLICQIFSRMSRNENIVTEKRKKRMAAEQELKRINKELAGLRSKIEEI